MYVCGGGGRWLPNVDSMATALLMYLHIHYGVMSTLILLGTRGGYIYTAPSTI